MGPRAPLLPAARSRLRPELTAAALCLLLQLPLHAGWLLDPATTTLANPFHGVHGWAGDVIGGALWQGHWPDPTTQAGFPVQHRARYVAWAVMAVGPAAAAAVAALVVNLSALLGPALGAVAMIRLLRRLEPDATPMGLWAAGLLFGLAPVSLGAAASGQIENAQSWVLPLLLLSLVQAGERPWRLLGVLPLWALGALTSPYLGMLAGFLAPWVAWRVGLRRSLPGLALAVGGLLLAQAWLRPGDFDAASDLFRPNFGSEGWPDLWSTPSPIADLDSLFLGQMDVQVRTFVVHQPYVGLILLLGALAWGRGRRAWLFPLLLGLILAMGPVLAWQGAPVLVAGRPLALPALALRWMDFPLARGGQYYRCALLAVFGLAGMLCRARPGGPLLAIGLLGSVDALRALAGAGLPWPVTPLPVEAWAQWQADPAPGAVLHLPFFSEHLQPNHPIRLAGHTVHGRALSDLPRASAQPPAHPLLQRLNLCTKKGEGCALPALSELDAVGFAFVVLDLAETPERASLALRLEQTWGPPTDSAAGLAWWRVPGAR